MYLSLTSLATLNLITPLAVLLVGMVVSQINKNVWGHRNLPERWLEGLTLAGAGVCLAISVALIKTPLSQPVTASLQVPFLGEVDFLMDALSVYFIFLVNVIAAFTAWNAFTSPQPQGRSLFFNNSVNLFHFTMLLVPLVDNLVVLWIAVEATTLVSTLLVSFLGEKNSWEAAWKYLIVTSTGIIFALLGTMFLANAAKLLLPTISDNPNQVMNWSFLMKHADQLTPDFIQLSFLFILVGYGTKAGFAPMHTWLPDGHGEAPAPISALLSGVLLKSALYAILRFSTLTNQSLGNSQFTSNLLLGAGLISLVLATPFILSERNRFKRVLAYHSLEHMGIITFGLGIGGEIALFGALLHTLNHALTKSLMFLAFGNVTQRFAALGIRDQKGITNVLRRMPATGSMLAVGGLALVGTPPFNIFLSELIIVWGAFVQGANSRPLWVVVLAIALFMISTALIFYGLIRHLARILLSQTMPDEMPTLPLTVNSQPFRLIETRADLMPLLFLTGLIILTGIFIWPPLAVVLHQSVGILIR